MEFTGRYSIPAQPDAVWAALIDPAILKLCIPGCEALDKLDANNFSGSARVKIGPLSAFFRGRVSLSELDPPKRCIVTGEGEGAAAGFVRGQAEVLLASEQGQTLLSYTANANVGGRLAQIGQRLVDGAAKRIAEEFFSRLAVQVGNTGAQPECTEAAVPETELLRRPAERPRRGGLAPEIWVVGLVAVVVVLVALFGVVLR